MVSSGTASSRSLAQRLIASGSVFFRLDQKADEQLLRKPGELLMPSVTFRVANDSEARFVSRSGLKLEAALNQFPIVVANKIALDIGQSTGGFSDCLLGKGCRAVVGADVGHDQLHPKLAVDERILCLERVNLREPDQAQWVLEQSREWLIDFDRFDLAVIDVSFITAKHIIPQALDLLLVGGDLVVLFKPQFEVGKSNIGSGGLVKNTEVAQQYLQEMQDWIGRQNATVMANPIPSPIAGTDGNQEYLIWARRQS